MNKDPRIATKAVAFPSPIKPPTAEDMKAMYYRITSAERKTNQPKIVALNDDWQSKGDWIDRIGRYAAVLCAQAGGGFNYFAGRNPPHIAGWIGRNFFKKNDALRHWVHWLESDDPRVLQCHALGGRKQAEWDDHKEVYPITLDGPHVYGTIPLSRGRYVMSFYFFNKDGHEGVNRLRDFQLTVKAFPISDFMFKKLSKEEMNIEKQFLEAKEHARLRVNDFWGGVYKRFYVSVWDNEYVHFQVNANYSFNTIVSGVFVDPVGDLPPLSSDQRHSPPRKPTDWAETLNNPEDAYWWWTINALDALLCVRDNDPIRFYGELRQDVLMMVRATIRLEDDKPKVPREIDAKDKELIRADVAKILHAASLHRYADLVDFTETQYQHYRWLDRNRLGRENARNSRWDWKAFSEFNKENKDKQTW